jgi:hypothetical protein
LSVLKESLTPLGIQVDFQKEEMSLGEFQKAPLTSNQIWLNDRLMEDWLGGQTGKSACCDACGPSDCRTVSINGEDFEAIPAGAIIRAGLIASSELVEIPSEGPCCPTD